MAIFSACCMPVTSPRSFIDFPRPSISFISKFMVATASLEPNAFLSSSPSVTSMVSPYLPFILLSMSTIGSIAPWLSVKLKFRASCALPTPAKNDLYFVPASLPDIVACNVPRIAICSFMAIPAVVACAPMAVNAPDISVPVVLKACTALAVMPVNCCTHSPLPIALAWFLKMPYMVPM